MVRKLSGMAAAVLGLGLLSSPQPAVAQLDDPQPQFEEMRFSGTAQGTGAAMDEERLMAMMANPNHIYTMRGLTLSPGTLRVDLAPPDRALRNIPVMRSVTLSSPDVSRGQGLVLAKLKGVGDLFADLRLGAAFGIVDGLEAGVVVLPLSLAPSGRDTFNNPEVYARYRLWDQGVEVGGQVSVNIPALSGTNATLTLSIPVRIPAARGIVFNTGVAIPIVFDDETAVVLAVPLEFAINVMPELFLGLNTGLLTNLTPNGFDPAIIPLGFFAGTTIALGPGAALDLQAGFEWITFFRFGESGTDTVDAETFQVTVGATLYMDVLGRSGG